jgi:hypothetical protein
MLPAVGVLLLVLGLAVCATPVGAAGLRQQLVPILGVTLDEKRVVGTVTRLNVSLEERMDRSGLNVQFRKEPGRLSPMAQTAIEQAIRRAAHVADLTPDSWTVVVQAQEPGVTVYGASLSAMVGLTVVAMAQGEFIPTDRVITGTITPDGRIAPVGSVPLKVRAAGKAHLNRILVPEEAAPDDGDWQTPFLVQVSPVGSVKQAYLALTDHALSP